MNIGVKELFRKYFKGSEVVYKIQIHTLSFGMEENGEIKRLHESIEYSDEEYTNHKDAVKKVKDYTEEPSPNNNYKKHNYLKYRKYYNIYTEVRD